MEKVKHSKVDITQDNLDICLQYCGTCPSYPGVRGEALFCARGKSSAPAQMQGCNCSSCEIFNNYGCAGGYFCIEGVCE